MKKMKLFVSLIVLALLWSCSSKSDLPPPKPFNRVSVEYQDIPLQEEIDRGAWIGGSHKHPVYFTPQGARIYTPLRGVVLPKTKRTIYNNKIIYPSMGFQLIGDMKVADYQNLVNAVAQNLKKQIALPKILVADSNRLSRGAVLKDASGKVVLEFSWNAGNWSVK